ncbi:MAG: DUF4439 domain-containing protein [Aeromicrobium sp.]|nr:MAG: DUF4439 domain-containing protein [Aeromicrobium sp.]
MTMLNDRRQALLELEHQAVWLFGTIAARSSTLRELALVSKKEREISRDKLRAELLAAEETPSSPHPGYPNEGLDSDEDMRLAARTLLGQLSAVQLELVALTHGSGRATVVTIATNTAASSTRWGAAPSAFPGLDPKNAR